MRTLSASVAMSVSAVLGWILGLITLIAVIVPTIRCGEQSAAMSENAFNPDNTHLWARCKTHENNPLPGNQTCIFVEDCNECLQNCRHDFGYLTHDPEN